MKKSFVYHVLVFVLTFIAIVGLQTSLAKAVATNPFDVTSLILKADPVYPKAGDSVTIDLTSYALDINKSVVRWYVDGALVKEGQALRTFTLTAPAYGSKKTVRVQVISSDGTVAEQTLSVAPSQITIVWQADTYTPPFYKGKRLYSNSSDIVVSAIPGGNYKQGDLIYTWKKDGTVIDTPQVLGKSNITIPGNIIARPMTISVDAISPNGSFNSHDEVRLVPQFPKILAYEDNPIYGIEYNNALGANQNPVSGEIKVVASPFFFSTKNRFLNDLNYTWNVGGVAATAANGKSAVILKKSPGVNTAILNLEISHKTKILQGNQTSIPLTFTDK